MKEFSVVMTEAGLQLRMYAVGLSWLFIPSR